MKRIVLITGGQRSGKSSYAEQMALSWSANPVYMATARVWDDEFRQRVERHQASRGMQWTNIEEEKTLSRHDVTGRVVVIDCVTLWCTNFFFDLNADVQQTLTSWKPCWAARCPLAPIYAKPRAACTPRAWKPLSSP